MRAVYLAAFVLGLCGGTACSLFGAQPSVTPADRAKAYDAEAKSAQLACKTYRFDRAVGLVPDVPAMTALCE
jgi:hypothetical protein